ncbi:SagB/ThcOx family dehydrogenase [Candidatus Fermentibacteria bacterium]|nr:SagB/ThcOx family dehydrogenase [Candidatus Fermentibacteria bacterium]
MRTVAAIVSALILPVTACAAGPAGDSVSLPEHLDPSGLATLFESRISTRLFESAPLDAPAVSTVLWAGCGLLDDGRMTVPSAGAIYPLELYLVSGGVEGLEPGIYSYDSRGGSLSMIASGDARAALSTACLGQPWVASAPASVVICARPGRTTARYGDRGISFVWMEAGHSSQNIYLMCAALGLGTVAVGAFDDSLVSSVIGLDEGVVPLYVMPFGHPASGAGM